MAFDHRAKWLTDHVIMLNNSPVGVKFLTGFQFKNKIFHLRGSQLDQIAGFGNAIL